MQTIYDIAALCSQKGIENVVVSPGSRSAPLVLAFARHPAIEKRIVVDERCAAYMALGMAQATGKPVVLVCTSGTAALNFAPAIAEAFYLQVPLLVLTADRPPEWVDQGDGQTIRQQQLYGQHVKKSYQLPSDYTHPDAIWFANRAINEAINLTISEIKGPVHVNVPLREPLYPSTDFDMSYSKVRVIQRTGYTSQIEQSDWESMKREFNLKNKKLVVIGQTSFNPDFIKELRIFLEVSGIPMVADVTANIHFIKGDLIQHQDLFLANLSSEQLASLQPDMLITIGNSLVSKNLKTFLRKFMPSTHWHVAEGESCADPFKTLTRHIPVSPISFLKMANGTASGLDIEKNEEFFFLWQEANEILGLNLAEYQKEMPFSDFSVTGHLLKTLPSNSILHVGNSMAIRYVNFWGLQKSVEVCCNRGTSGIDGCLSTALGAALKTSQPVTLLIGDLSFFYDSNALFQLQLPANLKIVVLNNHSGNIFKVIDGPSHLPEGEEYFETKHQLSIQFLAEGFGARYLKTEDETSLKKSFQELYATEGCTILEIHTDSTQNVAALKGFSVLMRNSYQLLFDSRQSSVGSPQQPE